MSRQTDGLTDGSAYRMAVKMADGRADGLTCAKTGKCVIGWRVARRAGEQIYGLP